MTLTARLARFTGFAWLARFTRLVITLAARFAVAAISTLSALFIAALARVVAALAFAVRTEAAAAPATTAIVAIATILLLLALRIFDVRLVAGLSGDAFAAVGRLVLGAALFVAIEVLFAGVAILLLLRRRRSRLHLAHEAEIMICVLEVILAQHPVA